MSDLITLFKNDVFKLIADLENKKIIDNIKKNSISIDYASKSKQGDISTNQIFESVNKIKLKSSTFNFSVNYYNSDKEFPAHYDEDVDMDDI